MYPTFSISSSFDFFSVHDILKILMYHISAASSLLSKSFVSVQHSPPYRRMDHMIVGFQSLDFGVNSNISVGEDGIHLGACVFRQSHFFLYFCVASGTLSHSEAQVFKGACLFYSFPYRVIIGSLFIYCFTFPIRDMYILCLCTLCIFM